MQQPWALVSHSALSSFCNLLRMFFLLLPPFMELSRWCPPGLEYSVRDRNSGVWLASSPLFCPFLAGCPLLKPWNLSRGGCEIGPRIRHTTSLTNINSYYHLHGVYGDPICLWYSYLVRNHLTVSVLPDVSGTWRHILQFCDLSERAIEEWFQLTHI